MECDLVQVLKMEEKICLDLLSEEKQNISQNKVLIEGLVYRNCTLDGWSAAFPKVPVACGYDLNDTSSTDSTSYFNKLKVLYTVGYSASLATLILAMVILGSFRCWKQYRRLRCTRNYIHMHLFASFILRAISIFIKDALLFSAEEAFHCSVYVAGCKMVLVLFQYCSMANYSWLLVEGLYLHTLLVVSFFSERKYFWCYIALGWGSPMVFTIAWSICRQLFEDVGIKMFPIPPQASKISNIALVFKDSKQRKRPSRINLIIMYRSLDVKDTKGEIHRLRQLCYIPHQANTFTKELARKFTRCWDINSDASIWWIIRGPVIISIFINFTFFVRIIRILMKKLKTSDVCRNDFGQYKRLARSTLLLICLFGVHYIIFAFFPEDVSSGTVEIRLSFELALGSFQGFVVAVLYCFLNGEVQFEIQRKWKRWHLKKHFEMRQHKSSTGSSGASAATQVMQATKASPKEQRRARTQSTSII